MAERKGRRASEAKAGMRTRPAAADARPTPMPTLESLERECERLRVELDAARREIAELRTTQDAVINRIDWAIDSLNSLLEVET